MHLWDSQIARLRIVNPCELLRKKQKTNKKNQNILRIFRPIFLEKWMVPRFWWSPDQASWPWVLLLYSTAHTLTERFCTLLLLAFLLLSFHNLPLIFNYVDNSQWTCKIICKKWKPSLQETDEEIQKQQLWDRKLQTDNFKDTRHFLGAKRRSVDLNDFIPFIDRPDTVVLHVGWWVLPVPCLDRNLPVWAIVGFNILQGLTGYMDLEFYKFSPAQSKLREEIPAPQKDMVTSRRHA